MKTLIAIVLSAICASSLQAQAIYTEYIVPNGYHGPLVMILDPDKGVELPIPPTPLRIVFDSKGKCVVRSDSYLPRHSAKKHDADVNAIRAKYANGETIPIEGKVSDEAVAFRSVFGVGPNVEQGDAAGGAIYFFVGTLKEAKQFESIHKTK
jgi:hypothetical protein